MVAFAQVKQMLWDAKNTDQTDLEGMFICFTGELQTMTRQEAKDRCLKRGIRFQDTITRKTQILVTGSRPGSKLAEAKAMGIEIINEKQFLNRW